MEIQKKTGKNTAIHETRSKTISNLSSSIAQEITAILHVLLWNWWDKAYRFEYKTSKAFHDFNS